MSHVDRLASENDGEITNPSKVLPAYNAAFKEAFYAQLKHMRYGEFAQYPDHSEARKHYASLQPKLVEQAESFWNARLETPPTRPIKLNHPMQAGQTAVNTVNCSYGHIQVLDAVAEASRDYLQGKMHYKIFEREVWGYAQKIVGDRSYFREAPHSAKEQEFYTKRLVHTLLAMPEAMRAANPDKYQTKTDPIIAAAYNTRYSNWR